MSEHRVVVTGMGTISSVGMGIEEFWKNIVAGKSGVKKVTRIVPEMQSACKIAAEISDFDPLAHGIDPKQAKRMDRFIQFAVAANNMAIKDAKLDLAKEEPTRMGTVIGSAAGGFETIEKQFRQLLDKGPDRVSPFTVPMLIVNMAAGWVSMLNNAKGPNACNVTACASSTHSIGDAFRLLQRGDADLIFAGGAEAPVTGLCMSGFASARTLSTRNDDPEKASRPWDRDRDGFVMGEGAGILILETLEHAQARGAKIYAEVVGYGLTADANDIVAPCADGDGAARAMQMALADAKLRPDQIQYVNAHGTSTMLGDRAETVALKRVFGDYAKNGLAVSSSKSMTGHLLGATGAVEAAITIMAIVDKTLPPTINLDNPDPECDLDYVPNKARTGVDVQAAMSNSFGFGGHNACIIFKKFEK